MNPKTLLPALLAGLLTVPPLPAAETTAPAAPSPLRTAIEAMKEAPRGPFSQIRWFCKDGAVLEPKAYACVDHGGGLQYGEWSEQTKKVRAAGYPIANVLAPLKPEDVLGSQPIPEFLQFLLLERFLVSFDDGWILRQARYYRGAFQDADEKKAASGILHAMLAEAAWREQRFLVLREAARLLAHGDETPVLTEIRGLAITVAEQDPGFGTLRNKIHNAPDAGDAKRVREHAAGPKARPAAKANYERLAALIEQAYSQQQLPAALQALAGKTRNPELATRLNELAARLLAEPAASAQLQHAAAALALLRERLADAGKPSLRLLALDASLTAEVTAFTAGRTLLQEMRQASRHQRLAWMGHAARAAYGMGLLTQRELGEITRSLQSMPADKPLRLDQYRAELQQLERAPGWASRRLAYHFEGAVERMKAIEPVADIYMPDRLRSSPMLFYSSVLDTLALDLNQLSGVRHSLFGQTVNSGLRRLNPGLGRGVLRTAADIGQPGSAPAIYLVPETVADLPPSAGILTAEEGNALSHVQLLARNLGVPNVVVERGLMPAIGKRRGKSIVVAASPGGVVRIEEDGPQWEELLAARQQAAKDTTIHINVDKLDLKRTDLIPTSQLGSADSGVLVGPKAAQVGELSRRYPGQVSPGLAIPFGVYRALLERPMAPGKPSLFSWMQGQYAELRELQTRDPAAYPKRLAEFLGFVRNWILQSEFDPAFRQQLREAMRAQFGADGSYGVFVRSDTNVEDLPGFTGAGLNLTVPNVSGFANIEKAIREVWASPFTERAFGWRQGLMDKPEHVYASVLLHKSVPSDRSGVLISANLDTGSRDYLTVTSNAGVGGGVEGQASETLLVNVKTGGHVLLSSATARTRRVLQDRGGSKLVPTPAPDMLLKPGDIAQLVTLVRELPTRFPQLSDAEGKPAPADIEFGFLDDRLILFQIRPFLQNKAALRNQFLVELDAGLRQRGSSMVDLRQLPARPAP